MKIAKWKQMAGLVTCFLMMLAVAITQNKKLFGYELTSAGSEPSDSVIAVGSDGTITINTLSIGKDIIGYAGATPLTITIKEGVITDITPQRNAESPQFFSKVIDSGILENWKDKKTTDALNVKVDAVTGATMSSNALIQTVERGLQYAENNKAVDSTNKSYDFLSTPKFWIAMLVILSGAILPLFIRNGKFRIIQLVLNVAVLGFWSGSFISYSLIVNTLTNGIRLWTALIPAALLIIAFIYPLFGKKNHYCNWICPLGSLQELAGKSRKRKLRMTPETVMILSHFREILWAILMLAMWSGAMFSWMDYEPFTAFLFLQAPPAILALAAIIIILSIFIPRPYCRFVCPTGTLMKLSQNLQQK